MSNVLLTEVNNRIGKLILNRPEKRNALSPELLVQIHLKLKEFEASDAIRVVIITGAGDKAFSSGYDILSIPTDVNEEVKEILKNNNPFELAVNSIINFPYPVIAMINGYVFGAGLNLAMCCDMRIGIDTMKAGMPPAKLGVVYHPEGLKQFIYVVGFAKTREIFLTAKTYQAKEALALGLVNYLVPKHELESFTLSFANEIAMNAPLSLKGLKSILNMLAKSDMDMTKYQDNQAEQLIADAFNSEDLKEGQMAFFEKRTPVFQGK